MKINKLHGLAFVLAAPVAFAAVDNPNVSGGTATFTGNFTAGSNDGGYLVTSDTNKVSIKAGVTVKARIYINSGVNRNLTVAGVDRTSVIQGTFDSYAFKAGAANAQYANVSSTKSDGKILTLENFTSRDPRNWHVRSDLPFNINSAISTGYVRNVGFFEPITNGGFATDALSGISSLKEVTDCTFNTMDDVTYGYYVDTPFKNCTFYHRSNGALIQAVHDEGLQIAASSVELRDLKHITTAQFVQTGNKQGVAGWAATGKNQGIQTINLTGTFTETKEAGVTLLAPFFTFGSNNQSNLGANDLVQYTLKGGAATEALAKARVRVNVPANGHQGKVVFKEAGKPDKTFTYFGGD